MKIFVVNCGSSSVKYKLYDMDTESVLASGLVERIGEGDSRIRHTGRGGKSETTMLKAPNHTAAMRQVLAKLTDPAVGVIAGVEEIDGVGHRVVHAGERYSDSVRIYGEVIDVIRDYFMLSPLHNPANLAGIEASMAAMPQ
ncbi:MAG: acetate kinase, partial [Planctomycetes bacterium]|nr:acetate kinase [Planctomycetota bacterium]